MIRMIETFSVPSNAPEDVAVYEQIFAELFNLANLSNINSTASAITTDAFAASVNLDAESSSSSSSRRGANAAAIAAAGAAPAARVGVDFDVWHAAAGQSPGARVDQRRVAVARARRRR